MQIPSLMETLDGSPLQHDEDEGAAIERDIRSSELHDRAMSIFLACKQAARFSELNSVIDILRRVLDMRPTPHPLRSDTLKHLAKACLTMFYQTGQADDLNETILLYTEALRPGWRRPSENKRGQLPSQNDVVQSDKELSRMTASALTTLTKFHEALDLRSLDTAISLYLQALHLRDPTHSKRAMSLVSLSDALLARFYSARLLQNLDEAITHYHQALDLLDEGDYARSSTLISTSAALVTKFGQTGEIPELKTAMELLYAAFAARKRHDDQAVRIHDSATALITKFDDSGQVADLDMAIRLLREALGLRPVPHHNRSISLNDLSCALLKRYKREGKHDDLYEAVSLPQEALGLLPAGHRHRWTSLNNLANALSARSSERNKPSELDEAIQCYRESLVLLTDLSRRCISLGNLAIALDKRFQQNGQITDLDEAISLYREVLESIPRSDPDRWDSLNDLANALLTRCKEYNQLADLDEAIALHREALRILPPSHPDITTSYNNLASALDTRFEQTGRLLDIDEAISFEREALKLLPVSHPDRPMLLDNLAGSLHRRFGQTGQLVDLGEAIALHREALDLRPVSDPKRFIALVALAACLHTHFKQTGSLVDLDDALSLNREAVELLSMRRQDSRASVDYIAKPFQHRDSPEASVPLHGEILERLPAFHRSVSLSSLANTLNAQFDRTGELAYLDEAMMLEREALGLEAVTYSDRWKSLNNLARTLHARFNHANQLSDLDEAVSLFRKALDLLPMAHPGRPTTLNNLASALGTRFDRTADKTDLDEAVDAHRSVLNSVPAGHPDRSASLNNLAVTLQARFTKTAQLDDLDQAISLHRSAVMLRPAPHPVRYASLNNLANALETRFCRGGQVVDLEEAIQICREALQFLPPDHRDFCTISSNLGNKLMEFFARTQQPGFLGEAMTAFRAAVSCKTAPVSARFDAARRWAKHADSKHDSALEAYQVAIGLLPRIAMLGLDVQSRQQALTSQDDGLARDAAACAIQSGQLSKAVELLEEGRAIFWSQALQLRTPLDSLRDVKPALALRLETISRALEQGSHRDISRGLSHSSPEMMTMEQEAVYYRRLDNDWLATVEEVRVLDGFHDFLRPKSLVALQKAASRGPVVMINASKSRCDILILTSCDVKHIPILELTLTDVKDLVHSLRSAISSPSLPRDLHESLNVVEKLRDTYESHLSYAPDQTRHVRVKRDRYERRVGPDDIFRNVLAIIWTVMVAPVVRCLNLMKGPVESRPRLWWYPTGPFAFLPIHAAGLYDHTEDEKSASDYMISSYSHSLNSLLARQPQTTDVFKMLVAIYSPPGRLSLPYTSDELRRIERHVPSESLVKLGIPGAPSSVESVVSEIAAASIVHFACHGQQNPYNPLDSALLLEDGYLKVSRIMKQSIPHASLAFLSACQTATGDEKLPDEAIHLAATLLFSGFRGAVATMWSIHDIDGPKIVDSFYKYLFQDQAAAPTRSPDTARAAQALHLAVAKLRAENCSFKRWVPFIHFGL